MVGDCTRTQAVPGLHFSFLGFQTEPSILVGTVAEGYVESMMAKGHYSMRCARSDKKLNRRSLEQMEMSC